MPIVPPPAGSSIPRFRRENKENKGACCCSLFWKRPTFPFRLISLTECQYQHGGVSESASDTATAAAPYFKELCLDGCTSDLRTRLAWLMCLVFASRGSWISISRLLWRTV